MKSKFIHFVVLSLLIIPASFLVIGPGSAGDDPHPRVPSRASYDGGDGTPENPYQISTIEQVQNMSSNLTAHYILVDDVDAGDTQNWNSGAGFDPIGDSANKFTGTIHGQNYSIDNMHINRIDEGYVGLIGFLENGIIQYLDLDSVNVAGDSRVGGICGQLTNSMMVNCTLSGTVVGDDYVGGLIGMGDGASTMVLNCSSSATLEDKNLDHPHCIGGAIGWFAYGSVIDCGTTGGVAITPAQNRISDYIGGFIGYSYRAVIRGSYSTASMSYSNPGSTSGYLQYMGVFIGFNDGSEVYASASNARTTVEGPNSVGLYHIGGFIGYNSGKITKSSSRGAMDVRGRVSFLGGFAGFNSASVQDTTSGTTLDVTERGDVSRIGGFTGYNTGSLSTCGSTGYIDASSTSSPPNNIGGLVGINYAGRVVDCVSSGTTRISSNNYNIYNIGGLLGANDRGEVQRSTSSRELDLSITGSQAFSIGGSIGYSNIGTVTGCGSSGNIDISGTGEAFDIGGLIGYDNYYVFDCSSSSDIMIALSSSSSTRIIYDIGGLAGYSSGNIDTCRSEGRIGLGSTDPSTNPRDIDRIGGLIGYKYRGRVYKSSSSVAVYPLMPTTGSLNYDISRVGGLVGNNDEGIVEDSYSTGSISINESSQASSIGGVVGENRGTVENSYSMIAMYYFEKQGSSSPSGLGGLVGYNVAEAGSISECYTAFSDFDSSYTSEFGGLVGSNQGTVTACFLDKDKFPGTKAIETGATSGVSMNTTEQMKKRETFEPSGWDFERNGESSADWGIIEDETYPWIFSLYHSPVINLDFSEDTLEDQEFVIGYSIVHSTYPSINRLTRTEFETDAEWLSHKVSKKQYDGTPENDDVGMYWFYIETEDLAGETPYRNISFEVINVNDPPQIITEDVTTVIEDEYYSHYYYAIDIDPILTRLTWTMSTNARWLFFEGNHLYGTPYNYDQGYFYVNITVYDFEGDYDFSNFTLTVESANDAPVITTVPIPIAIEDEVYVLDLTAEDVDENDELTWELVYGPSWLMEKRTQVRGTPTNDDVGKSWVEIKVTDLEGAFDQIGFILDVKNSNDAPAWKEFPPDQNITEGELLLLDAIATDIDLGDRLTYDISSEPPSNITINPDSGSIKWLDTEPGNYTVNVSASDGKVLVWRLFTILVNERSGPLVPGNSPPVFGGVEDQHIEAGKTLKVEVSATDAEGDRLIFSVVEGPEGAVISSDGVLVWTPFDEDVGSHLVNLSVSDGWNTSYVEFSIEVLPSGTGDDDDDDDSTSDDDEAKDSGNQVPYIIAIAILAVLLLAVIVLLLMQVRKKVPAGEEQGPDDGIMTPGPAPPELTEE